MPGSSPQPMTNGWRWLSQLPQLAGGTSLKWVSYYLLDVASRTEPQMPTTVALSPYHVLASSSLYSSSAASWIPFPIKTSWAQILVSGLASAGAAYAGHESYTFFFFSSLASDLTKLPIQFWT